MYNSIALLFVSFVFMSACNNDAKTKSETEDTSTTTTTNNSVTDTVPGTKTNASTNEHGCLVDNGERWSLIRKSCVIFSKEGTKIDAKDPALDASKPAYLLFDSVRVEILLPTQERTVVMRKTPADANIWESGVLKLTKTDAGYKLEDEGKLLYASGQ